jgi:hypothetical protein
LLDERPPVVMLAEHYADRPALPGNARSFQGREEELLLLSVVAFVGEDLNELEHLFKVRRINFLTAAEPSRQLLKN